MQGGPNWEASRVLLQLAGGTGGRKRRSPIGGFAKGIPRHWSMSPCAMPRTGPLRVVTGGPGVALTGAVCINVMAAVTAHTALSLGETVRVSLM
jgi:hypothetical protein